jgi:hypothetical protein
MLTDQSLMRRLSRLRDVWSQYIESKRQFLIIAERCCVRGWPDQKLELRNAFRLQELYCEQEKLRLEHLIAARELDASMPWKSLVSVSAISKIIHTHWTDAEEAAFTHDNADYMRLSQEIDKYQHAVDPTANAGPYSDAQRDPEYVRARQAAAEAIIACDEQLAV